MAMLWMELKISRNVAAMALSMLFLGAQLAGCTSVPVVQMVPTESQTVFARVKNADAAYELDHWEEAARHYRAVIKQIPEDAYAWFRLGNVRLRQGRYAAAIEAYQKVLAREPGWSKAYYNLSTAYLLRARAVLSVGLARAQGEQARRIGDRAKALTILLYGRTRPTIQTNAPDGIEITP